MSPPSGFHLHVLHERKAPYPTISSYKEFFGRWWSVSDGPEAAIPSDVSPDRLVLWHMMGMYCRRLPSRLTIHDYRSRSVGSLCWLKDMAKKAFNARPDIRLFQTEFVKDGFRFHDGVPEVTFTLGVPSFAFDLSWSRNATVYDFGYVGMINRERHFDTLLRRFLDAYQGKRSFLLIGPSEQSILDEFAEQDGLSFTGKLPHRDALERVLQTRCGVCYVPNELPYSRQIPTKMLEYATMGMPIIANDVWTNIDNIRRHHIVAKVTEDDLFAEGPDPESLSDNLATDMAHLHFQAILSDSGLVDLISEHLHS